MGREEGCEVVAEAEAASSVVVDIDSDGGADDAGHLAACLWMKADRAGMAASVSNLEVSEIPRQD